MRFFITLFFVFTSNIAVVQTESILYSPPLSDGTAEDVGMSSERLSRIDDMIGNAIEENQIPGAVALVARDDEIVYKKAFGIADNQAGRELRTDDIFRIASQTKAITSTAVMMLWEQGLFRLDDPIGKYIPEFEDATILESFNEEDSTYTTIPTENQMTIRHLLTHTSGLGYGAIDADERFRKIYRKERILIGTTSDYTIEENIKKLAELPLHHEPGEKYTYSLGLDVLGYFVEVMSGIPFDEYLRIHIFNPLKMDDTWFYLPESKHDRLVTLQRKDENGNWEAYPDTDFDSEYPRSGAMTFFSGGGGLSSTVEDYAKFLQIYLNNGEYAGKRLLSRTTVNFMMQNQMGDLFPDIEKDYGLAFGVINEKGETTGGRGSLGTFGWGGAFNTQYFADPQENVIGLIFKQTQGPTGDETGWKFRQLVFQAIDD